MYSIIDSCDETSGWHLPGLCNVKETALSFAAEASPCEDGGNLATMSPAGLNILRCQKASLHTVDCTTEHCQEREFFLSRMWLAPLRQQSITFQWLHVYPAKNPQQKQTSTFRFQQLVSVSVQPKETFCSTTVRYSVLYVWDVSCVWLIFVDANISAVWCPIQTFQFHTSSVE